MENIEYYSSDSIVEFLQQNKIYVKAIEVYPSFAFTTYLMEFIEIPKLSYFNQVLKRLEIYLGSSIKYTDKFISNGFKLSVKNSKRIYPDFLSYCDNLKGCKPGSMLLGLDEMNKPVIENIENTKSILIGGSSGGGKSVALHNIINSLLCFTDYHDIKVAFIDLKQCEFKFYKDSSSLMLPIANDYASAINTLKHINSIIDKRYKYMQENGIRKATTKDFPIQITFIDEYAMLTAINQTEVDNLVSRIASVGRACNCYIVIATQHAINKVISNTIRANLQSRIGLRAMNIAQSSAIIGTRDLIDLIGYGDSYLLIDGQSGLKHVQICNITDDDLKEMWD